MKAMIFAAGLGTRLKPLTDKMPKALVPICGKPLLAHVLDKLHASGIDEVTVNVHHFAQQIKDYLKENEALYPGVSISDETEALLDTGGGIRHAAPLLRSKGSGEKASFLVHNVDILSDLDLRQFCERERMDALATLLVSERETNRYLLFDEEMRLAGWTNVSTGEIRSWNPDLVPENCRRYAFSGIHIVSDEIFDAFKDVDDSPIFYPIWKWERVLDAAGQPVTGPDGKPLMRGPVMTGGEPLGEKFPIIDFYLRVAGEYPVYGDVAEQLKMIDVGKFDKLDEAEALCRELMSV